MMQNKLILNKSWSESEDAEYTWIPGYIQNLINLYCFDSHIFNVPEDINLDNFQIFLEIILRQRQYGNISVGEMFDIVDAIEYYFYEAWFDDRVYPKIDYNDRRNLVFNIFSNCDNIHFFPEDVPFLIKCMNVPDEQIVNMYDDIDNYFHQFDLLKRFNIERPRREKERNKQRIEAINNNEPVPIRPMGIELDKCCFQKLSQVQLLEMIQNIYNDRNAYLGVDFDIYGTFRYNNLDVNKLFDYIEAHKLSPEEILEECQLQKLSSAELLNLIQKLYDTKESDLFSEFEDIFRYNGLYARKLFHYLGKHELSPEEILKECTK